MFMLRHVFCVGKLLLASAGRRARTSRLELANWLMIMIIAAPQSSLACGWPLARSEMANENDEERASHDASLCCGERRLARSIH